MDRRPDFQECRAAALAEAAKMHAAAAKLRPGGTVTMDGSQFMQLANLIHRLAEQQPADANEFFHETEDGIRWWVPLPEFKRAQAELEGLRNWRDAFAPTR